MIKIDDRNKVGPQSLCFPVGLSFSFREFKKKKKKGNKIIKKHQDQDKLGSGPSPRKLPAQPGRMGKSKDKGPGNSKHIRFSKEGELPLAGLSK